MKKYSLLFTVLLSIIIFSICTAEEGLVIECEANYGTMGMGGEKSQMKDFITNNKFRSEEQSEPYGIFRFDPESSERNTVSIKYFESLTGWDIDLLTKTYVPTDLNPVPDDSDEPIDTGFVSFDFPQDTLLGSYDCVTTLDSSNVIDTINGYPCYKISLFTCCKNSDLDSILLTTDIWICNDFPGMDIYLNYQSGERRTYGVPDTADMARVNLDEKPAVDEMLKFHSKVGLRKTLVYNSMVMKYETNLKMPIRRFENMSESSAGADSTGFMDAVSDKFKSIALTMYQKMFASGQDELFMNIISMSYEVTDIKRQELDDSLFVLPDGYTLKEETATE